MCSYSDKDKVNGMNGWSGFQDFPPDNEIKIDGGHHITCGQKRDVSITAMIVLAVQMANNAIGAASWRGSVATGTGPLTSISAASDPYFVRSYHSQPLSSN